MTLEIEINGSAVPEARYIANAPSPCRIRQTAATDPLQVTLFSEPALAGGGQAVLYDDPANPPRGTLELTLPADGTWVDFSLGGKWGSPSVDDGDCLLIASGGDETLTVPLMVRVRKNAETLLPRERDRFLEALAKLNDAGTGLYQTFRDIHVLGMFNVVYSQEHAGPHFLPWHRIYLLDLERELQAIDPSVSLHYWRFDEPAPNVFSGDFMGETAEVSVGDPPSDVGFATGNLLAGWVVGGVPGISRSAFFDTRTSAAPGLPEEDFPLLDEADTLALGDDYFSFAFMEATPHGAAHVSFAGSISDIDTAAMDPLFFMLHANVDRLWALWQWLERRTDPDDLRVYEGQQVDGRRLEDSLWPWNDVVTPPRPDFALGGDLAASPASAAPGPQPVLRGAIDFQGHTSAAARIGYGYDDVPFEL